ncbi:MAG: exosortase/archaeosortase family protein, partial [Anaerohalosphaera sp.]|nr:exosortase/archaeosortase family protein [Anaerohalosphaera sp.]
WLPITYLLFAVPLPDRFYTSITIPMRKLASQIATMLMNLYPNLEAEAKGVVIDVVYNGVALVPALNVAEACSGMRLLMTFVALGVAMAYLHERPIWQRLVLLCSTFPIAIICNIIRVTITGFIYILGNPKYAQGHYHDGLGLLMLPIAFGLYGGLAWMMANIFVDDEDSVEDVIIRKSTRNEQ